MPVITIFSAAYCHGREISGKIAEILGYSVIEETELVEKASAEFKVSKEKLSGALTGSTSLLGKILEDRDRNVAYLRSEMARIASKDNIVYLGYAGLLIPKKISHMLRVCLVAENEYRIELAQKEDGLSEKDAASHVKKDDSQRLNWTNYLFGVVPWDESLHDIIIPMHSSSIDDAVKLIVENAGKEVVKTTAESKAAMQDFILASQVKIVMAEKKQDVDVSAENGKIIITLKKYVMRLEHHKDELRKMAANVPGVGEIDFQIGPTFKIPSTYPHIDLDLPKKILLVDDEVEFVQTLSERLQTRQIKSSVVYNGEEALSFVEKDEPEVMVLDLKMPGIDGIEVLRRTKKDHPNTEIIILTGHGSEREKQIALELGAFAYLEKPVDIDVLAETMKKAYARVNRSKQSDETSET